MTDPKFEEIVKEYSLPVFKHCYKMLKNKENAEETAQDVFMKIYNKLGEFRKDSSLKTWIYRITVNTCLTRLYKKKDALELVLNEELDDDFLIAAAAGNSNPEKEFLRNEAIRDFSEQISKLAPIYSLILTLFYIDGLSYAEISQILNIPIGTIGTNIFRAREELKQKLSRVSG